MLESSWAVVDFGASSELPMGAEDFSVAIDELLLRVSVRVSFVRRVREEFCVAPEHVVPVASGANDAERGGCFVCAFPKKGRICAGVFSRSDARALVRVRV